MPDRTMTVSPVCQNSHRFAKAIVNGVKRDIGMFEFIMACVKMWWQLCGGAFIAIDKQHICDKDQQSHSLSM